MSTCLGQCNKSCVYCVTYWLTFSFEVSNTYSCNGRLHQITREISLGSEHRKGLGGGLKYNIVINIAADLQQTQATVELVGLV